MATHFNNKKNDLFLNEKKLNEKLVRNDYDYEFNYTMISALSAIVNACSSGMDEESFRRNRPAFLHIQEKTDLTPIQIIFLAILAEECRSMNWSDLARHLSCNRLDLMKYTEKMEELIDAQWVHQQSDYRDEKFAFRINSDALDALCHNHSFQPRIISGLSLQQVVDILASDYNKVEYDFGNIFEKQARSILNIYQQNQHIKLCKEMLKLDFLSKILLSVFVANYALYANTAEEGVTSEEINNTFENSIDSAPIINLLRKKEHPFIQAGWVDNSCNDGLGSVSRFELTPKFKKEFLGEYMPLSNNNSNEQNIQGRMTTYDTIAPKEMFYNEDNRQSIERLKQLLQKDNLPAIQARLQEKGMRKGFACLFYGAPGTGKTETVLQLARETGRDILQVNISGMRDKWVGESEKNIKAVFDSYRRICANNSNTPILFFNEADALINKRVSDVRHSVDKMDNSMQNILLQEIENLDGILIATTNLTENLDKAFERRFLYKINFEKPDVNVRAQLWRSMLGDAITEKESQQLACQYEFSGGEIENISRKQIVNYILTGKQTSYNDINVFCAEEGLASLDATRQIGFVH